jgi:hypothetical protein
MDMTLVSQQFADRFIEMLERKECVIEKGSETFIDMRKFKSKIKKNDIDIEYLNQLLKSDNQYVMEGENNEEEEIK